MAIPTFTSGYPPDNFSLGQTKSQIRDNLDGTFQAAAINHYSQNQSNPGKHKYIQLPSQVNPTSTAAQEILLFNGGSSIGGTTNLWFSTYSNGTVNSSTAVQMTRREVPIASSKGYSWLPGGILLQWGSVSSPGSAGSETFTIPFPNNFWNIQLSYARTTTSNAISFAINSSGTNNLSQFTYYSTTGGSTTLYWVAIGN
jgi:hypothetical protein